MNIKKIIITYYSSIAITIGLLGGIFFHAAHNQYLLFAMLDIGQGDSLYIRTPRGINIVIDGGPDNKAVYALDRYLPIYNRTIHLLVLSHPDADHLVAFNEMLQRYDVQAVLMTNVVHSSATYAHFKKLLIDQNIKIIEPYYVANIKLDTGIELAVLYPRFALTEQVPDEVNATSVVLELRYPGGTVLLTGDTTKEVEQELVKNGLIQPTTILKVAHHGSDTSSDQTFLAAAQPKIAIISVGHENTFGHPHQGVIERLGQYSQEILRTDQVGDIVFELNLDKVIRKK